MDTQGKKLVGLWLSIFLLLPATSLVSRQTWYRCGSCGGGSESWNSGLLGDDAGQASGLIRNVTQVEGDAKERALEKLLYSKDFKVLAKVLAGMGYEPSLEDAAVLEVVTTTAEKEINYSVVGICFIGDPESRTVVAVISLEPVQEALAFRLDNKTRTLELLVEVRKGEVEWVRNSSHGQSMERTLVGRGCQQCQIPVSKCTKWDLTCISIFCKACWNSCYAQMWGLCAACLILLCPSALIWCCIEWTPACETCGGGNCYNLQYCHNCPGCGG